MGKQLGPKQLGNGGPTRVENRGEMTGGYSWPRVKCLVTSASTTTMSRSEMPGVFGEDLISQGVVKCVDNCLVGDLSCR